jgi:hypothetical protein
MSAPLYLALRVAINTAWAGVLVLVGLWLATFSLPLRVQEAMIVHKPAVQVLGVLLIAMGQYVFACLVADRLFPKADRVICGAIEVLTAAVYVGCALYLIIYLFRA